MPTNAVRERVPAADLAAVIQSNAHALTGGAGDYTPLLGLIGNARFALLGEASHGTDEFYRERARITRQLIAEKEFQAVVVEADWPDAYRVNRYVRGFSDDSDADAALSGFKRFPAWMWRNTVVREFVEWLREYNDSRPHEAKIGFYGMDLYSLRASMQAVVAYLDKIDPEAARRARYRYGCFDHFGEDPQSYGYATGFGMSKTCEDEVVAQSIELMRRAGDIPSDRDEGDELFYAEQNARLVKNAEAYYRSMFRGRVSSWNLRDQHMAETLDALDAHLSRGAARARIAVWAHNSHLGDSRATEMNDRGELNVGRLVRERLGRNAVLVGFSTHRGAVTAASDWGGEAEVKRVRPGLSESVEALFHETGMARFLLCLRDNRELAKNLESPRLERAIGVIYLPETERLSHYFHTRLAQQFDAMIHIDETRALQPLESGSGWLEKEAPETFPSGV
ncbi:MAG: erythromycin esterase family protein [Betaproteobacteria bacterium]|nr:MAG: erythromycin esterase family protein [Betaproteobacteria bacterium]